MMKRLSVFIIILSLLFLPQMASAKDETRGNEGFVLTAEEKEAVLSSLYEADVAMVKEIMDLGLLTCEEVTEYYLQRIREYNEEYNCFITICEDSVEKAAERDAQRAAGEASGALFGVPVVIKDNMDLSGYPTTNGYASGSVASENAYVTERLLREGAVIIGKANMSAGAQDARTSYSAAVGETKNAYNTDLSAGGSSGGTAAAVSLNFACAGLGTDTNSSLRIPAVLNGCASIRGTFGTISTKGIVPLDDTRDVPGAVTRSVPDLAVMMDVITDGGHDYSEHLRSDALDGVKLGLLTELSYPQEKSYERTQENVDQEVLEAFEEAVGNMRHSGADIIDVSMPDIIALSEAALTDSAGGSRGEIYAQVKSLMEEKDLDALIFPTYLSSPLKSGTDEDGQSRDIWSQVFLNNCYALSPAAGIPEMAVTIGFHSSGAGIGMEIAALEGDEQLLLDIAHSYMKAYGDRQSPEGAPDLHAFSENPEESIWEGDPAGTALVVSAVGKAAGTEAVPGKNTAGILRNFIYVGMILLTVMIVCVYIRRDSQRRSHELLISMAAAEERRKKRKEHEK